MIFDANRVFLSMADVADLARDMIQDVWPIEYRRNIYFYAIRRGGVPVGYALMSVDNRFRPTEKPEEADFFVDDIIDTGDTMNHWCDQYPGKPFLALISKGINYEGGEAWKNRWIVFPWEETGRSNDDSVVGTITNRLNEQGISYLANDNIADSIYPGEMDSLEREVERRVVHLLQGLLIDTTRDHNTQNTARRIAKMYLHEVFRGRYERAPSLTEFPNFRGLDEVYVTGPITVRSTCSHHLAPIIGRCWIGVLPGDKVIGLSKFNRLVDWIVSRPQIQEEMAIQLADLLEELINPLGLAIIIEATHMCMTWRGVREDPSAKMTTSVMRGAFREKPEARAEFMAIVNRS